MASPRTVIAACGLLLAILPLGLTMAGDECVNNRRVGDDCGSGYSCVDGKSKFHLCGRGTVFSLAKGTCVTLRDVSNDCANEVVLNKMIERYCLQHPNVQAFAHPLKCNLYVNCSKEYQPESLFPEYQDECLYPNYFDKNSGACAHQANAWCSAAQKPTYICSYIRYSHCRRGCKPCTYKYGDCRDLGNGLHPFYFPPRSQGTTDRYYNCQYGITIGEVQACPDNTHFDSNTQRCVANV